MNSYTHIFPNRNLKNPFFKSDKYRKLLLKQRISFSEEDLYIDKCNIVGTIFNFNPYKNRRLKNG